ncbi:hypothetical protein BpsM61_00050 [Bacillus phage vB_BpsM-61]|nr:hypothetical protein BpsM61_00050 [Bacillus phage vB_BpsM-61]
MNLQPRKQEITVQREFLKSTEGLIHKVGGVTLDAAEFTAGADGFVRSGSAVSFDEDSGLAVPFTAESDGIPYVLAHDVRIIEGQNPIVGAVETAFLDRSVVTDGDKVTVPVTDEFIEAASNRYHLR